jgi:RNA polymerase sigma-70 factor (ECF subfamily)
MLSLFGELAGGRTDALSDLFDVCGNELYGLALWRTGSRLDAEDAVQEVWLRLARTGRPLSRVKNPRAYLFRMTRNAAVDIVARRRETSLDDGLPIMVTVTDPDTAIDGDRASRLVLRLPPKQREAVYLHQMMGLSFREIAEICGVPTFTAASRHRLGLKKLRTMMGVDHA